MKTYDTIIIGSGLAGLTAALLLKKKGREAAVFEQSTCPGGRAQTRQRHGFFLNLGPHALYRGGAAAKIFEELGIEPAGGLPKFGKNPRAVLAHGTAPLPVNLPAFATTPLLRRRRTAYLKAMAKIMWAQPDDLANDISWQTWMTDNIADDQVRELTAAIGRLTTYAHDPQRTSAGATIAQIKLALKQNVLYLDRGWGELVNALVNQAAAYEIPIFYQAGAQNIQRDENGHFIVSFSSSERCTARQLILAIPPKAALNLLPHNQTLEQAVKKLRPIRAACLTVGLRRLPRKNTLLALGVGLSYYHVVHSSAAALAPSGQSLIHTAIYIGPDDSRTPEEHRAVLEDALDHLQPGWRATVAVCDYLPRLTVAHAHVETGHRRPPIAAADRPGIFLVGDWVDAGAMLTDNSLASAREAVNMICST